MEIPENKIGLERKLIKIQAVSGLLIVLFVSVHLLNVVFAISGYEAYNSFQRKARTVYQFPPIEIFFVLLPILVHIIAGLFRLKIRKFRLPKQNLKTRLHYLSGYFLLLVIFGHILAVRGSSVFFDVYPEFGGLSFSLWWIPWLFYPYYILFALASLYHSFHGFILALTVFKIPVPKTFRHGKAFWGVIAIGSILLIMGILGFGGWLYKIPDPTDNGYAQLYEKYLNVK